MLSDFRAAVEGDLKRNHDAQPAAYRAPGVLLETKWSYPIDICRRSYGESPHCMRAAHTKPLRLDLGLVRGKTPIIQARFGAWTLHDPRPYSRSNFSIGTAAP